MIFTLRNFYICLFVSQILSGCTNQDEAQGKRINVVKEICGPSWNIGSIERQQFYEETKNTYCIVSTSETRPFGCFIFTKGVIKPDGTVWVLDK